MGRNALKKSQHIGFTMVEMVVMLSIITAISALVLVSFTGVNENTAINRSSRELALAIRKAQNMSLAVTQIEVGSPPAMQIPPAVGVRLSLADPTRYFLFADLLPLDNRYTGSGEKIGGSETTLERGVKINRLSGESGTNYVSIHIIFTAPEARIILTDDAGAALTGDKIDIEIITPSGRIKKTVTVRVSGQVSIK